MRQGHLAASLPIGSAAVAKPNQRLGDLGPLSSSASRGLEVRHWPTGDILKWRMCLFIGAAVTHPTHWGLFWRW